MCIAIPMRVCATVEGRARCADAAGREADIDLALVGEVPVGTWLLTFMGAAREVVTEEHALAVSRALEALAAVMRGEAGDIDAAFPDLAGREPQLPEFLRRH